MSEKLLSQAEFKRVSQLAGIAPRTRAAAYTQQLDNLLKHFSSVQKVKTGSAQVPHARTASLRQDTVEHSMPREDLLRSAPASQDGYIKVKPVA